MTRILTLLILVAQIGCASRQILRDKEYDPSMNAYRQGDIARALDEFPRREANGFITSVERSWLNVWENKWDTEPLQTQVHTFDSRNFTSLTREAEYFLFQESEEGYVPSEHEVTILHLLSATHFLQQGKVEDAKVEMRQAGYILDRFWDDASLRLWLASLWAAVDEWPEAVVDLRRANELSPQKDLEKILKSKKPQKFVLHFYGAGPMYRWGEGVYEPRFYQDPIVPAGAPVLMATSPWMVRHIKRNTALRDALVSSNFMAQYLGSKTLTGAETGVNKATTWTIRILSIIFAAAIVVAGIYLMLSTGASGGGGGDFLAYLFAAAVGVGAGGWRYAEDIDRSWQRHINEQATKKEEDLRTYRMIRFMPTWIGLSLAEPSEAERESRVRLRKTPRGPDVIWINHY